MKQRGNAKRSLSEGDQVDDRSASEVKQAWTIFLCPDCKMRCPISRAAAIVHSGRPICDECFEQYTGSG